MAHNLPSVWMNELTWQEVAEYLKQDDICIVPVGTNEEHGPAGTLGLDTYVAIALAEDTAKRTGVVVAPPLWYGDSSHHMGFAGTISLRTETLIAVISDIGRSLARHGFRKVLIINGHKSSNLPALYTAVKNLREYELPGVMFAVADPMYLARGIAGQVKESNEHHAGELEISHVWYKFPQHMRPERFSDAHCDFPPAFGPLGSSGDLFGGGGDYIEIPWTSEEQRILAPTGQFSDNSKASQAKGKRYHDYMVDNLVRFIDWWRSYNGPLGSLGPKGQ